MSLADEITDALKSREADLPLSFTWQTTSYACSASSFEKSKKLDVGGFDLEYNLILTVRKVLFSTSYPTEKQTITHKSKTFRIEKVIEDPSGTFLRLHCNSATQ